MISAYNHNIIDRDCTHKPSDTFQNRITVADRIIDFRYAAVLS